MSLNFNDDVNLWRTTRESWQKGPDWKSVRLYVIEGHIVKSALVSTNCETLARCDDNAHACEILGKAGFILDNDANRVFYRIPNGPFDGIDSGITDRTCYRCNEKLVSVEGHSIGNLHAVCPTCKVCPDCDDGE